MAQVYLRGQTQALSVLTLGDYQLIDGLGPEQKTIHASLQLPNFSVGERPS